MLIGERFARWHICRGSQWIDRLVGDTEFVMKMGAGRPPRRAHVANQITLRDLHARLKARSEATLVSIEGCNPAVVLQDHGVAIAILLSHEIDGAIGGGVNWGPGGGGIINTGVVARPSL